MRVLLISREYPPFLVGGIARRLSYIVPRLIKKNIEFEVVCYFGRSLAGEVVHSLNLVGSISVLKKSKFLLMDASDVLIDIWRFNKYVSKLLSSKKYDLVQIEEPVFAPFLRLKGIPKIVTVHTSQLIEAKTIFSTGGLMSNMVRFLFSGTIGFFFDLLGLHNADVVIAAGDLIKEQLMKYYRVPDLRIKVVNNSIEAPIELRKELKKGIIGVDKVLIIYVGRLVYRKHVDVLIRAVYELMKQRISNFVVYIVGTGPQRKYLVNLVKRLKLNDYVIFKGYVDDDTLFNIFEGADIFVSPSSYESGMPLTVLEAMAYGCFPIVADIPTIRNNKFFQPGTNMMLFPVGDIKSLSNVLYKAVSNESFRDSISDCSRKDALLLSWDESSNKYFKIYNQVMFYNRDLQKSLR